MNFTFVVVLLSDPLINSLSIRVCQPHLHSTFTLIYSASSITAVHWLFSFSFLLPDVIPYVHNSANSQLYENMTHAALESSDNTSTKEWESSCCLFLLGWQKEDQEGRIKRWVVTARRGAFPALCNLWLQRFWHDRNEHRTGANYIIT